MAFRVTNNDTRLVNIPPEYGGGILRPGSSAIYGADTPDQLGEAFATANYGRDLNVLGVEEVPDSVTDVRPGSYVPAAPGHWAGQPPRTLTEAVNRLAAAFHGGFVGDGSTGIP